MRPCLKTSPASSSSKGLSFSSLSSCTPSTSSSCQETTHACQTRKCVAFEADAALETVFFADEWDRTPTEPARKLSYQDLLELKEIQRSLPRANQPPDHLAGRAGRQYLTTVPISLLPLLPSSSPAPSPPPPTPSPSYFNATTSSSWNSSRSPSTLPSRSNWTPLQSPSSATSPSSPSVDPSGETRWVSFNPDSPRDPGSLDSTTPPVTSVETALHPPRPPMPHMPGKPYPYPPNAPSPQSQTYPPPPPPSQPGKQKPRFAFLPLLDSAPSGETTAPPSSSSTAQTLKPSAQSSSTVTRTPSSSDDETPSSKWSSKAYSTADVEPPYFQLPPPRRAQATSGPSSTSSGTTHGSRFSAYYNREGGDWEEQARPHRSFGSAMNGSRSRSKSPSGTFGRSHPAFQAVYPAGVTLSPTPSRSSSRHASPARPEVQQAPVPPPSAPSTEKKKNVMVINGIEIDLDEEESAPAPVPAPKEKKKNVMVINGIEIDLDEDDEDEEDTPLTPVSTKALSLPPSSPIAQPRPMSPTVSSRSPSSSPKSGSTRGPNGLPTPPPSTSPSPVPSWRALPVEEEKVVEVSPFVGLHAPVTFKRAPRPAPVTTTSPPPPPVSQFKTMPPLGLVVSTSPTSKTYPPPPSSPSSSKASTPTPSSPVTRGRSGSVSSIGGGNSRTRRGSVCGQQSAGMGFDPRMSPRLVPRA